MNIKSALRDDFAVSYGIISILRIGSLRSPPPIRLRRTSPASGGRINRSMLSCRDMAPWLSTHSAPSKRGKGGGASHQRGIAFPRPSGRLYGFSCCRKAAFILAPIRALTTTLAPKGETTHYDLCVALLLQIMFAVHAKGASNLSPLRTFGPAGRQPSRPYGRVPQSFAAALAFRQSSTSCLPKSPCSCSNLATTGAVASCQRWISSFGIT